MHLLNIAMGIPRLSSYDLKNFHLFIHFSHIYQLFLCVFYTLNILQNFIPHLSNKIELFRGICGYFRWWQTEDILGFSLLKRGCSEEKRLKYLILWRILVTHSSICLFIYTCALFQKEFQSALKSIEYIKIIN